MAVNSYYELFDDIITALQDTSKHLEGLEKIKVELLTLQVIQILLECCISLSKVDKFLEVLNILENFSSHDVVEVLVCGYNVVKSISQLSLGCDSTSVLANQVSAMNNIYQRYLKNSLDLPVLKMILQTLSLILNVCGSTVQQKINSDTPIVKEFVTTCGIMRVTVDKCLGKSECTESREGSVGKSKDDATKLYFFKCQKLQFALFLLQSLSKFSCLPVYRYAYSLL